MRGASAMEYALVSYLTWLEASGPAARLAARNRLLRAESSLTLDEILRAHELQQALRFDRLRRDRKAA